MNFNNKLTEVPQREQSKGNKGNIKDTTKL